MAPTRWQAIIWTNDGRFYWRIYASLGLNKLTRRWNLEISNLQVICSDLTRMKGYQDSSSAMATRWHGLLKPFSWVWGPNNVADITVMSLCAWWRPKSPASRLFTQPFIQAQIKENMKAPCHWPLCGEFTGDRWIPRTNGQYRGKCFHLMTSSWRDLSWSLTTLRTLTPQEICMNPGNHSARIWWSIQTSNKPSIPCNAQNWDELFISCDKRGSKSTNCCCCFPRQVKRFFRQQTHQAFSHEGFLRICEGLKLQDRILKWSYPSEIWQVPR